MAKREGFTLIELLVVIAIIGILASSVIIGLSRAQTRARDANRKNDLAQVRKALEAYAVDNPAGYPAANGSAAGDYSTIVSLSSLSSALTSAMDGANIPEDPRAADGATWRYKYINNYAADGGWVANASNTTTARSVYTVYARLEAPKTEKADSKAIWWQVNSKGSSFEKQMSSDGATY